MKIVFSVCLVILCLFQIGMLHSDYMVPLTPRYQLFSTVPPNPPVLHRSASGDDDDGVRGHVVEAVVRYAVIDEDVVVGETPTDFFIAAPDGHVVRFNNREAWEKSDPRLSAAVSLQLRKPSRTDDPMWLQMQYVLFGAEGLWLLSVVLFALWRHGRARVLLLLIVAVTGCWSGCYRETPVRARVVNLEDFAMYSARSTPDETHTIEVTAPDGTTWYREGAPGLDLGHITFSGVHAVSDPDSGGGIVVVPVAPEHYDTLSSWSRERIGNSVVYLYEGKRVGALIRIEHEARSLLSVRTESRDAAERLAQSLRSYGR